LSRRRVDLAGEAEEPMLLQWQGSLEALRLALEPLGWKVAPEWSMSRRRTRRTAVPWPAARSS